MRIRYDKTVWVDNETPVDANNMNKIENALETLYNLSLSPADFNTNSQIKPVIDDGNISLSFDGIVLKKVDIKPTNTNDSGIPGDFYLDEENNFLYLCLNYNFWIRLTFSLFN